MQGWAIIQTEMRKGRRSSGRYDFASLQLGLAEGGERTLTQPFHIFASIDIN